MILSKEFKTQDGGCISQRGSPTSKATQFGQQMSKIAQEHFTFCSGGGPNSCILALDHSIFMERSYVSFFRIHDNVSRSKSYSPITKVWPKLFKKHQKQPRNSVLVKDLVNICYFGNQPLLSHKMITSKVFGVKMIWPKTSKNNLKTSCSALVRVPASALKEHK